MGRTFSRCGSHGTVGLAAYWRGNSNLSLPFFCLTFEEFQGDISFQSEEVIIAQNSWKLILLPDDARNSDLTIFQMLMASECG